VGIWSSTQTGEAVIAPQSAGTKGMNHHEGCGRTHATSFAQYAAKIRATTAFPHEDRKKERCNGDSTAGSGLFWGTGWTVKPVNHLQG
jgi:hypothetical protein